MNDDFTIVDGVLTKYTSPGGTVRVPDGVTEIGASAFYYRKDITQVILPDSVQKIGNSAFHCCYSLSEINFPDGLNEIGEWAFHCTKLKSLVLPEQLLRIGAYAFDDSELEEAVLPSALLEIERGLFNGCSSLCSVRLPDRLLKIGEKAFEYSGLKEVELPVTVAEIGDSAFRDCKALERIRIPGCVKSLGFACFEGCTALKHVDLPEGLKDIRYKAFLGCTSLTEIHFPKSLSRIGDVAFFGCKSLESIVLHPNLEEIGEHAFANCRKLNLSFAATKEEDWGCAAGEYVRSYKPLDEVILSCPICGSVNAEPLELKNQGDWSEWIMLIAYLCVSFHGELPEEGAIASATVDFPFCCKVGECFNATFDYQHVITARLIRIMDTEISSAEVELEVLSVRSRLDFVKPLSRTELSSLGDRSYDTSVFPHGDLCNPQWRNIDDRWFSLENSYGGGDINDEIRIYTDEDGVDHLVQSLYSDMHRESCLFGDKVLGFHEDIAPVNGLRIDWATDSLIHCVTNDKLVTIPYGVRRINWCAFEFKDIECLYIPESVREVEDDAFHYCSELKKIVLAVGVEKSVEEALRSQCPKAEIVRRYGNYKAYDEYKKYDKYEEYEEYENYWKSRQKRK